MFDENNKKRPLSGKFPSLKDNLKERAKLLIPNSNKLNSIKELNDDKLDTKFFTKTFAETKENNNNSSINQFTEKTEFLEMLSKQKENDKEALDNILINEVNRIKNVNEKRKKLNDINLIEKNYEDLYIWQNLFNNSRPLSHYTTLKKRKIEKTEKKEENKGLEEFKSPVILVDLYEEQMNMFFGKNNFIHTNTNKKKIKSAKVKNYMNNNQLIIKNIKNPKNLSINTNLNSDNNTLKTKKSASARNRIMTSLISKKSQKNKSHHKHIRPMSVYSPRVNTCSFYFSNAFSDYYKEDLKSFSEKMKILKAKVKSNPGHLKHEINEQRKISFKKEMKLEDIINSNKIVFDKDNLIIAADRKNPIPLLKSIFKMNYPDKEVMKENIKMYYNTMKPMGNCDEQIDYTKNERWKFCEKFSEMRDAVKNENSSIDIRKNKNLKFILKYYDENDPYIQMFEKMVKNRKNNIKDLNHLKNDSYLEEKNYYNPILSNVGENLPFLKETEFNIKTMNNKDIIEETNRIDDENNINVDIRPKTGFISVASHANTNFNFYNNSKKNIKRPRTSNVKEINIIENNYYVPNSNLEYKSKDSFPVKTSSNVGNVSYDKINQMLQERHFGLSKIKNDYFMTSTGQSKKKEKKLKYREEKIILPDNRKNKKISDFGKIKELGLIGLNEGVTPREKKIWVEEYFKNFRGKHYSSSNNVHIKNKRKNKIELLNKYYTQSQYSNDEPDIEFVDRSVSSQTNSFYRK